MAQSLDIISRKLMQMKDRLIYPLDAIEIISTWDETFQAPTSKSEYVIADSQGQPLSGSQFQRIWHYVVARSTKEHSYYKYVNGQRIKRTITPVLGGHQKNNPNLVYSIDFEVTPHQLRHTYITNLLYAGVDPKTVQYLAGHKNSKTTMDIYAQVKYNKPEQLLSVVNAAFAASAGS